MRVALAALVLFAASPAAAQYVGAYVPSGGTADSIRQVECNGCEARPSADVAYSRDAYAGVTHELREIDGKRKVIRRDALWGGSPVTTVTSATLVYGDNLPETGRAFAANDTADDQVPATVDADETTAAVAAVDAPEPTVIEFYDGAWSASATHALR